MTTSTGDKKTIQINHDFFQVRGKVGRANATQKRNNVVKTEKKKPKPIKHNTIKRELIKRIQEHKQREKDEMSHKNGGDGMHYEHPTGTVKSEFAESINYLNLLSKANHKNANPKPRAQRKKSGGGTTYKTLKNVSTYPPPQMVNIDLPPELLPPELVPTNGTMPSNIHPKTDIIIPPVPTYSREEPPYSNLKTSGGARPTYKQWSRTRKAHQHIGSDTGVSHRPLQTVGGGYIDIHRQRPNSMGSASQISSQLDKPGAALSVREQRLKTLQERVAAPSPPVLVRSKEQSVPVHSIIVPTAASTVVSVSPHTLQPSGGGILTVPEKRIPRKRIIRKTVKQRYTVGRSKLRRRVSVLIKNNNTRKNIQSAKKELKRVDIGEVKRYLKERSFLKTGSVAPNNVLREMYESARMSGDLNNSNVKTMIQKYVTDNDDN